MTLRHLLEAAGHPCASYPPPWRCRTHDDRGEWCRPCLAQVELGAPAVTIPAPLTGDRRLIWEAMLLARDLAMQGGDDDHAPHRTGGPA